MNCSKCKIASIGDQIFWDTFEKKIQRKLSKITQSGHIARQVSEQVGSNESL